MSKDIETITTELLEIAKYHLTCPDELSYEYNKKIHDLYDKISDLIIKNNLNTKDKDSQTQIIDLLENLPRNLGGSTIPISLDLMFRCDGHGFSKFLSFFKKIDHQPFSLQVLQTFINSIINFSHVNEFREITTFYMCSDEITGLSPHGTEIFEKNKNTYIGSHPFGGRKDKVTSMLSAMISVYFFDTLRKMFDLDFFEEICAKRKVLPTFDARIFPTNQKLVGDMFISRMLSCSRNTVSEFHDYFFGTKSGFKMSSSEKKQHMLEIHNYDYDVECPKFLKYGVYIKNHKAYVPLKIPKNDDKFIEFLYSKDYIQHDDFVPFEDIIKNYNNIYIPKDIYENKKIQHEEQLKYSEERKKEKEEKAKDYPRPSKEEIEKARLDRKKQKLRFKIAKINSLPH